MLTFKEYSALVNNIIETQSIGRNPQTLYEPIRYTLLQKGKRLRPVLALMANALFEGKQENIIYPAIGLEIFHNFTLIHDDIMDQAPIRRGMETVYKKWNTATAILSGDAMYALAYTFVVKTPSELLAEILPVFNQTGMEVCEGQQYDMEFEQRENVTLEEYLEMIRLKTAVLLAASLKIGAITAHANPVDAQRLYDFGIKIGLAFQLQDDLLDVYSDEATFGKINGGDIATNKKTFLYLKAMEIANPEQKAELIKWYSSLDFNQNKKYHAVKSIYDYLDISGVTHTLMNQYLEDALELLSKINAQESHKAELAELAQTLMDRKK